MLVIRTYREMLLNKTIYKDDSESKGRDRLKER